MQSIVIKLALTGLIGWVLYRVFVPRPAVRLVITSAGLISSRGAPAHIIRELESFFSRDVVVVAKVVILGDHDSRGQMRFRFRGLIDQGTQQQIRNYLQTLF